MNRIQTCPRGGPTLNEARRAGTWVAVTAAVAVAAAMAGLTMPAIQAPASPVADAPMRMAAQLPAAAPVPSAAPAGRSESRQPDSPAVTSGPGDLGEALEQYRAALAEKPADAELLANVGRILMAMDRPAGAVSFLEKAVEAEPSSVVARFDLAVACSRSGELKEAVEHYETLVQSGGADTRVHHNLGLALRLLGRHAEAAAAFERATAMEPERAPAWLGLALSLEADGRGAEAATALEHYLALEPATPDADDVRARIVRLQASAGPALPPADDGSGPSRRRP